MKTWSQVRQCKVMQARCDYIMGTDRRHFKIVGIRGVRYYPSDHFTPRARILIFPTEVRPHCGADGLPSKIGYVHRDIEEAGG